MALAAPPGGMEMCAFSVMWREGATVSRAAPKVGSETRRVESVPAKVAPKSKSRSGICEVTAVVAMAPWTTGQAKTVAGLVVGAVLLPFTVAKRAVWDGLKNRSDTDAAPVIGGVAVSVRAG